MFFFAFGVLVGFRGYTGRRIFSRGPRMIGLRLRRHDGHRKGGEAQRDGRGAEIVH
jgi:hypothetical protein